MADDSGRETVYGRVAAEHVRHPRNLGVLADADGLGQVDDEATETFLSIGVRLGRRRDGTPVVAEARFRAFGCGGCIATGSAATELARGLRIIEACRIDGAAVLAALEDGLPPEQRYCADLAARALQAAVAAAISKPA